MRATPLFLCLSMACTHPAPPRAAASATPTAAGETTEPPPAYHAYPEITPDELPTKPPSALCHALPTPPPEPRAVETRVSSGPPVTNHLPPEILMRPIRERAYCLRECYERTATITPPDAAAHRVSVRFVVDVDGYVRRSRVQEVDGLDASVGECVARQVVGLQFPRPVSGPVTVIYPFRFASP